eukprot:4700270-Pyramimonas_sp.AAC.1
MDSATCLAVLSACEKGGRWEAAAALARDMKQAGHPLPPAAYASVIGACRVDGQWQVATEWFQ